MVGYSYPYTGRPSPPSFLSYNYSGSCTDSHATVDIHWLPPMDTRTTTEQYNLTITPINHSHQQFTFLLDGNTRNTPAALQYDIAYIMNLRTTICGALQTSEGISMEVYVSSAQCTTNESSTETTLTSGTGKLSCAFHH